MKKAVEHIYTGERESAFGRTLDGVLSIGLMGLIAFTSIAYGAVEPWSIWGLSIGVILLLGVWLIKGVWDGALTVHVPPAIYPLGGLFLLACFQCLPLEFDERSGTRIALSLDVEATRMAIELLGYMIIVFLLAANFAVDGWKQMWFRNFIVLFGLAMAVFGLVQHFTWNGKFFWVVPPTAPPPSPFGTFVNHNHFAGFMELIAPIPMALILVRAVRGELALLYGFAAVMMVIAHIASLSRGGMVSLLAGMMFVISMGLKFDRAKSQKNGNGGGRSRRWSFPVTASRYGAVAVMVGSIIAGVWWMGADPVIRRVEKSELSITDVSADPRKETFYQSRGWIWRDTMEMIRKNWLTGVGIGAYHTAYPIFSNQDGTIVVSQAHNDFLQAAADGGVLGVLIVVWFLALMVRDTSRALRHRDLIKAGTALGCAGGVFALLVHSLFDFNLQLPSNAILFLTLSSVISQTGAAAVEGRVSPAFLERAIRLKAAV
jgi:O-antigen ligase